MFDGAEELLLDGRQFEVRGGGQLGTGESLPADGGGNFQGAGDLGEVHFTEVFLAKGIEETLGGGDEFLRGLPFLFTETLEAIRPIGHLPAPVCGDVPGRRLEEAGIKGLDAFGPGIFARPLFDCGQALGEAVGDGLEGAGVAEVKPGHEGAEGARGLAGRGLEPGRRSNSGVRFRIGNRSRFDIFHIHTFRSNVVVQTTLV